MPDTTMPEGVIARLTRVAAGYPTSRGTRQVLDGVDFDLHAGELVSLLGPNGSGKSTLVRILAGTLAPSAGAVELFGRPIAGWDRGELSGDDETAQAGEGADQAGARLALLDIARRLRPQPVGERQYALQRENRCQDSRNVPAKPELDETIK